MAREIFCMSDELPEGEARSALVAGVPVMVARWEGNLYAVGALCPHKQADLGGGLVTEGAVACRLHLWEFDLATGACRSMPSQPIPTYATGEDADGIWVDPDVPGSG